MNLLRIAFTGWAGSGKTTAAKYLAEKFEGDVLSFAYPIKYIDRYVFGTTIKNRERLQKIGEFFREFDPDIWVKHLIDTADLFKEKHLFVDDLRRENEYEALLKNNFKIVRIVADEDLRIKRLMERDGHCDVSVLYNESESGVASIPFFEIENSGTLEEFYEKLDTYIGEFC